MQSYTMFRLVLLAVLLLQTVSVFGQDCNGICRKKCGTEVQQLTTKCSRTAKVCCPLQRLTTINQTNPKFPENCGSIPHFSVGYITGGKTIDPNVYSWVASLEYNSSKDSLGICAGSVINSLYVLTAAHCVSKNSAERYGNVTGVRLGNFENDNGPYCDYGGSVCEPHLHFEVAKIIAHSEYGRAPRRMVINDIALIKLKSEIQFTAKLQPICLLPFGAKLQPSNLVACGWGRSMEWHETRVKRAANLHVWNDQQCQQDYYTDSSHVCAGQNGTNTCDGDSGGPLMSTVRVRDQRRMVLEAIISQGYVNCNSKFHPSIGTRVHNFLSWIENNIDS